MKHLEDDIFIVQDGYTKKLLNKFNILESKFGNTLMECGTKLSKLDGQESVDLTFFKRHIGSLRYLACDVYCKCTVC